MEYEWTYDKTNARNRSNIFPVNLSESRYMDRITASRIDEIFNSHGDHPDVVYGRPVIRMKGFGAEEIRIEPQTPAEMAAMLRRIANGFPANDDLTAKILPLPVELSIEAQMWLPPSLMPTTVHSLTMRFNQHGQSNIVVHEMFAGRHPEAGTASGPGLEDFIKALEAAGTDWANVRLTPEMQPSFPNAPFGMRPA